MITKKFKSLSTSLLAMAFFMVITLGSCGTAKEESSDTDDVTEQVEESTEHHSDDHEHSSDSTHEEHPAGEHPEGEHPEGEHPSSDDDGDSE
ncbi:hypothetical protein [Marinigracilibium pacificum]|uniref:Uncharacterized protein n=1 Tax=Marinigracilibium pacificum TaxID=2729599 RepID=A0A848J5X6_9BACT|nr:hypothetical protein [Marinigracilibium pacificum]NMM49920.1 hypothetical protein [Marinigracilibium pacificum]